jgi:hypothetical protein
MLAGVRRSRRFTVRISQAALFSVVLSNFDP